MSDIALYIRAKRNQFTIKLSVLAVLAILVGIVMPLVAAVFYPTYTHMMTRPWVEFTRLQELPFVACETLVILWAMRKGMNSSAIWSALPKDIRIASAIFLLGAFGSSILISAAPLVSLSFSLFTVAHVLFAFAVSYLFVLSAQRDESQVMPALGAGLILLAGLTAWKFALPPPASQVPGGVIDWSSALPGFISVRHFGSWTGAVTAGFMTMLLYSDDKQRLSWRHFCFFVAAAMTIWSGTRAAVLALAITAAIIVLSQRKLPHFRAVSVVAMLTGVAMTAAWLLLPYNDPEFRLFNISDVASPDDLAAGRLALWAATFDRWLDSPWLGWGSGSTFWEVYVGWTHTQPHNAVLQFLISWGVVGTAGALWLLGRATLAAHQAAMRRPELQPLLAILYTLLLMSLVEGMLHYPRFIMLIMLLLAIILSDDAGDQKQLVSPDTLR